MLALRQPVYIMQFIFTTKRITFKIEKLYLDHVLFTIPPVTEFKVVMFRKTPYFGQPYYSYEYCISYFQGRFYLQSRFRVNKLELYVLKS